ncbi:hypothetical protein GI482_16015 [Bacillus sp. N3536]|nr:hypothetical protein GI482_16015 [Bacillus sp. N3536]
MKKKNLLFALSPFILGLSIMGSSTTEASSISEKEYEQKTEVQLSNIFNETSLSSLDLKGTNLTKSIAQLSDEEFDRFMYNVVKNNDESTDTLTKKLDEVGVEFAIKPKGNEGISINAVKSNDVTLTAYSSKRSGDSYYRISGMWDASIGEVYSATEDPVSIEWDPSAATYYGSAGDNNVSSVSDVGQKGQGIVMFTVVDDGQFDGYATVYVTKKSSSQLFYGIKYIHSYSTFNADVGGEAGINFERGGITGGFTFNIQQKTNVVTWQKWDDNTLYY